MAKKSKIAKDAQRRVVVAHHAARRADLKARASDQSLSLEDRVDAGRALARLPRDASPTRLRDRDVVDGRPRAVMRAFGLSRTRFREMAHAGELPGITTSSW